MCTHLYPPGPSLSPLALLQSSPAAAQESDGGERSEGIDAFMKKGFYNCINVYDEF